MLIAGPGPFLFLLSQHDTKPNEDRQGEQDDQAQDKDESLLHWLEGTGLLVWDSRLMGGTRSRNTGMRVLHRGRIAATLVRPLLLDLVL